MVFLQWKKCLSDPKQVLKLTAVLICMCVACYQLSGCLRKMLHPPISTHYSFKLNETLNYPALTICRNPPFKTAVYGKYGITSGDPKYSTSWKKFKFENYTIQEFFDESTYTLSEIIPFYGFDGFDTNVNIHSFFLLEYGRCFTLTPKNETTKWDSTGYFLYFSHTDTVKKPGEMGVSLSGFDVFIHDRREVYTGNSFNRDSLMDYIYVEAGEEMRLNVKLQVYEQIPMQDYRCNSSQTYSQSQCQQKCVYKKITESVGCSAPWMPNSDLPLCDSYDITRNLIRSYTIYGATYFDQCTCIRSCNLKAYSPYIQYRKELPLPESQLSLAFTTNLVTVMREILGYDWNLFLADLGGSLGFLLGLSVLGIIGVLENMIKIVVTRKNEKETEPKESKDGEDNEKKIANNELEIYLNDKKLIDELVSQTRKNSNMDSDSKFYMSQNDKDHFIQNKY